MTLTRLRAWWARVTLRTRQTTPLPAPLTHGGVLYPRVTRTLFGRCRGVWLMRLNPEVGIRVRARSIPEAVNVICANRGLEPRSEVAA